MFATGRIEGYVNEQIAIARGGEPSPMRGLTRWSILIGELDTMHGPRHVERYWRAVLPDSNFELAPDAGRFMAMTHPDRVARVLGR